jgi:opacity protein-like surface antigen
MRQRAIWATAVLVASLFWFGPEAYAEPYGALYGGIALVKDSDFNFSSFGENLLLQEGSLPLYATPPPGHRPTTLGNSATFGGKIGYWFDALPFIGAEMDISTFRSDIKVNLSDIPFTIAGQVFHESFTPLDLDARVVTIGFSVMGRYPFLQSPTFPRGRLQPYAGVGPAIFITKLEDQEAAPNSNLGSKTTAAGGVQVLAGVKFFIINKLSLFTEYKFTHHTAEFGGTAQLLTAAGSQAFNVHHFYGGLAWHFY